MYAAGLEFYMQFLLRMILDAGPTDSAQIVAVGIGDAAEIAVGCKFMKACNNVLRLGFKLDVW